MKLINLKLVAGLIACLALSFASCHKDDDIEEIIIVNDTTFVINEVITDTDTTPLECVAPAFLKKGD